MAKGLKTIYQKVLKNQFGTPAILFPVTQTVQLGDYGYFVKGFFQKEDNIFSRLNLNIEDYIDNRLDSSAEASYLIQSGNSQTGDISSSLSGNKLYQFFMTISFASENGFVLQMQKVRSESLALKRELEDIIADELKNEWRRRYRLVWQRNVTKNLKFAASTSKDAAITLKGEDNNEIVKFADLDLGIYYTRTKNMNTEMWIDQGEVTPIVYLAKFTRGEFKPISKSLFSEPSFDAFDTGRFTLDNSDSFDDLYDE